MPTTKGEEIKRKREPNCFPVLLMIILDRAGQSEIQTKVELCKIEQLNITKLRRVSKIVSREMIWIRFTPRFSSKAEEGKVFSCNFETKRHLNTAEILLEKAGPGWGS